MRFRTNSQSKDAHLTSSTRPAEWSFPDRADTTTSTRRGARKCPLCLSMYNAGQLIHICSVPDASDMTTAASNSMAGTRKHSTSSSMSSVSGYNEYPDRSSRFVEHLDVLTIADKSSSARSLSPYPAGDNSLLQISGASAQRRRRRTAESSGSDDRDIRIGTAFPRRIVAGTAHESSGQFYHLNGVRMNF